MEQLLAMSVTGDILILALLVLRRFCGQFLPRKCFIWISMVLMFRLLLPVQVPVLPEQIPTIKGMLEQMRMAGEDGKQKTQTADRLSVDESGDRSGVKKDPVSVSRDASSNVSIFPKRTENSRGFVFLWLCGVVLTAGYFLQRMWKESHLYLQALPADTKDLIWKNHTVQIPVYHSDQIPSPVAFGILRGRIVIPTCMLTGANEKQEYILLHEGMHICHRDNLKKMLAVVCVCMHWFSPLVWIWIIVFYRDLELACDETVLTYLGKEAREAYALTLIAFMEQKQKWSMMNSGFGQTAVKERIVSIMNYRKKGLCSMAISAALICFSLTVFAEKKPDTAATVKESDSEDDLYDSEAVELDFAEYYTSPEEVTKSSYYPEYEKLGLSYNKDKQVLLYHGKKVVFLADFISTKDNEILCYEDKDYFAFTEDAMEGDFYTNAEENSESEETESNSNAEYNRNVTYLFALRDNEGKLTGFQIPEVSQGDLISENANTDKEQEGTETDLVNTAIIGGADGPTSIFWAGKSKK